MPNPPTFLPGSRKSLVRHALASVGIIALGILLLAGCSREPVPVLELRVSEGDWREYSRSLDDISGRLAPAERSEFTNALQELKYEAMMADNAAPGADLNAALRGKIAGWRVRDVLIAGHTFRLNRKQEEEKALRHSIAMNRRLRTRPGDEASATFLQATHVNQAKQWETLHEEIVRIQKRLNELDPTLSKEWPVFAPLEEPEPVVATGELEQKPVMKKPAAASSGSPF